MKPEVYAKAMYSLSHSGKSANEIVAGTIRSLKNRGAIGLLPKVLSSYKRLVAADRGLASVLTVARDADADKAMQDSGAQGGTRVDVDNTIVGGYRLESNSKLVDNSFKTKLLQAYRNATKA